MTLCCREKDEKKEAKIASSQPDTMMWWMVVWGWLKRCGEKWWRRERESEAGGVIYACGRVGARLSLLEVTVSLR
jgi:hypothetical protein